MRVLDLAPRRDDGFDLGDLAALATTDADREHLRHLVVEAAKSAARWGRQGAVEVPPNGTLPAAEAGRYDGRVLDVRGMLALPDEPIPWRCKDLAADGYLTVLAGRGGEGKSWMALALACGVARGQDAAGIECAKGRAVLFDAENGPRLTIRGLRAAGVNADLAVQPVDAGGLRITEAKDMAWMRKVIDDHAANLVIFDSLRVLSSGSKESDGDEMEPIVTRLKMLARETRAAIILVHHRGKSESSDYRGSSTILDQTDLLFTLGRVAGDPEGRHRRKITTAKCRIDEEPGPRWVAIEADRDRGLVYVNESEAYEPEISRPRDELRGAVLDAIGAIGRSGRNVAKAVGRRPDDSTVKRTLADLESDGLIEHGPDGWIRVGQVTVGHGGGPGGPPP